jgi:ribosomal protein S18 acetylase RimI-like enzyme
MAEQSHVTIRDLSPEDIEAIVQVALAAWEPIYAARRQMLGEALFAAEHPDWRAEKARQVRAACGPDSGGLALVAELDGRIVGFATCYANVRPGVAEIGNNAVCPDCRGRGIAPQMYARILERMKAAGMHCVRVTTGGDAAHAPARRAYEKAGFEARQSCVTYYREL